MNLSLSLSTLTSPHSHTHSVRRYIEFSCLLAICCFLRQMKKKKKQKLPHNHPEHIKIVVDTVRSEKCTANGTKGKYRANRTKENPFQKRENREQHNENHNLNFSFGRSILFVSFFYLLFLKKLKKFDISFFVGAVVGAMKTTNTKKFNMLLYINDTRDGKWNE